jgi:hypothetical protein
MTSAELIELAKRLEIRAGFREKNGYLDHPGSAISDMRLAARLARFAAERGGLEEEVKHVAE